jgi:putative toxin-antitoxin system antitoxin component (TIGR02293 family)
MSSDTFTLIEALGGKSVLGATLVKHFLGGRTVQLLQSGLPYRSVELLRSRLRLTKKDLSHYLAVAPRTLERRQSAKVLHPQESERVYRLARVYAKAVQVLGSEEQAVVWLRHPSKSLGNVIPLSLLASEEGARQVENELNGIEHNTYA